MAAMEWHPTCETLETQLQPRLIPKLSENTKAMLAVDVLVELACDHRMCGLLAGRRKV